MVARLKRSEVEGKCSLHLVGDMAFPDSYDLGAGRPDGISISTAERWAQWAKCDWAAYAAERSASS